MPRKKSQPSESLHENLKNFLHGTEDGENPPSIDPNGFQLQMQHFLDSDEPPAKIKKEKKEKPEKDPIYDRLPRTFISEFIEIYKSHECLWKPKSPNYWNRKVKKAAWQALIDKYREVHPNPNKTTIRRKVGTLRSSFRREYIRYLATKDSWQPHKPKLWYYDQIAFIAIDPSLSKEDPKAKKKMKEEAVEDEADSENDGCDQDDGSCDGEDYDNERTRDSDVSGDPLLVEIEQHNITPRVTRQSTMSGIGPTPIEKKIEESGKNEHDLFGQTIAAKIKNMSASQQILAEKLIFDVLCYGRMERLEMETSIQNLKKL